MIERWNSDADFAVSGDPAFVPNIPHTRQAQLSVLENDDRIQASKHTERAANKY